MRLGQREPADRKAETMSRKSGLGAKGNRLTDLLRSPPLPFEATLSSRSTFMKSASRGKRLLALPDAHKAPS